MTPQSLPELDTGAFRRAIAAALGLPIEGKPPRVAAAAPASPRAGSGASPGAAVAPAAPPRAA